MVGEPVDFGEIAAWAGLRRIELDDWEITALRRMDIARRAALSASDQPGAVPTVSAQPMSVALFDATFDAPR